jgi:hypothetical protein
MVLVLLMRGINDVSHRDGLRWHDIYISGFMEIDKDMGEILRLCLRNLRGCNVGNTAGWHL